MKLRIKFSAEHAERAGWILLVLTLGMSGILAQILLWRELLVTYSGNELSLGFTLSNWLVAEALGALVAGKKLSRHTSHSFLIFGFLTLAFCVCFGGAIALARTWRIFGNMPPGFPAGFFTLWWTSFLVMMGPGFFHGALFTVASTLHHEWFRPDPGASVMSVYVWETTGTLLGGLGARFLFHAQAPVFAWIIAICLSNALALWLTTFVQSGKAGLARHHLDLRRLVAPTCLLMIAVLAPALDRLTTERQWKPYTLLSQTHSVYSTVTVLHDGEQYLVWSDGRPVVLSSAPDRVTVEERSHLAMAVHPHPARVLVLGDGIGGLLGEVLKHTTVEQVDYAEPETLLIRALESFPNPFIETELHNPRLRIHRVDGYRFLRETPSTYDIIWVGYSDPATLHINRYFTRESFALARSKLAAGGLLIVEVPSYVTISSEPLRQLQASIHATLRDIFPRVHALPGDAFTMLLGMTNPDAGILTPELLAERLRSRRILAASQAIPWHLEKRLHPGRHAHFASQLEDKTIVINRILHPIALYYSLRHWQQIHLPTWATRATKARLMLSGLMGGALLILLARLFTQAVRHRRDAPRTFLPFVIFTTGFAGMLFDLLILLTFQSTLGYVYSWVGLLVSFYMTGAVLGAATSHYFSSIRKHPIRALIILDSCLICFCVALAAILKVLASGSYGDGLLLSVFLTLSALSGLLTGSAFPLAAAIQAQKRTAGRTAGILLASDLMGGWLAGILGCAVWLPLWGVVGTCAAMATLKIFGLVLLTSAAMRAKLTLGR